MQTSPSANTHWDILSVNGFYVEEQEMYFTMYSMCYYCYYYHHLEKQSIGPDALLSNPLNCE